MKTRFLVMAAAIMLIATGAQAGLWSTPIDNAGFEADGVTTGWANYTADWFDSDYWGTFLIPAGDGSGPYPEAVEGGFTWAGLDGVGTLWQQVGTWDADQTYDVSALLGQRAGGGIQDWEAGDAITIALYAGNTAPAVDADIASPLWGQGTPSYNGLTLLDSIDVNPFDVAGAVLTERVTVSLNTGTAMAGGEGLFLALTGVGTGQKVYDNVSIVPEPATMALLGLGGLFLSRRKRD